jgi:hypothetical protein
MKSLVDIVNFNADASCLSAPRWLQALRGGAGSELCKWLGGYVDTNSRVTLGFIGGTLADIAILNPEAIEFINAHPLIFEVLIRPFAHDIALTRSDTGFRINLDLGQAAIRREFRQTVNWYLPPEFMLNSRQLALLPEFAIEGVFVNPGRYDREIRSRLSRVPFYVSGVSGTRLACIPFESRLTEAYLSTIQLLSEDAWVESCNKVDEPVTYVWRDGESAFLLPDGVEREKYWLDIARRTERLSLAGAAAKTSFLEPEELASDAYRSYPVHSFAAWMKEFRMLGYLRAIEKFEGRVESMSPTERLLWLQAINSDVLSAVEKASPSVRLRACPAHQQRADHFDYQILRTERGFEGEEYMHLLETLESPRTRRYLQESDAPHMVKMRARLTYSGIGMLGNG